MRKRIFTITFEREVAGIYGSWFVVFHAFGIGAEVTEKLHFLALGAQHSMRKP
jgi:hypothetical protein